MIRRFLTRKPGGRLPRETRGRGRKNALPCSGDRPERPEENRRNAKARAGGGKARVAATAGSSAHRGRRSLAAARGGCGSRTRAWLCAGFLAGVVLTAAAARAEDDPAATGSENALAAGTGPGKAETLKRSRLEFDERLIMGQSLKSGAIYLFDRKDSQIQSMVKIRKDFREELLSPLEPSP